MGRGFYAEGEVAVWWSPAMGPFTYILLGGGVFALLTWFIRGRC